MRRLIVVQGVSALLPVELASSLMSRFDLHFMVGELEHTSHVIEVLEEVGTVSLAAADIAEDFVGLRAFRADGIVCYSERMLPTAAKAAERLGLAFNAPETVSVLRDKSRQREVLRSAGIDSVRHRVLTDSAQWAEALDHVGLPLVLKPLDGAGSLGTQLIVTPEQGVRALELHLASTGNPLLAEEYLEGVDLGHRGAYVSVEVIAGAGSRWHVGITGKLPALPPFRETGQFVPSQLAREEEQQIRDLADRVLDAVGFTEGIAHLEFKLTPDGPRVIEVNGRLGGFIDSLYRDLLGVDVVEMQAGLACDPTTPVRIPDRPDTRVVFQYTPQPPMYDAVLTTVVGIAATRALAGVGEVRQLVPEGTALPWDLAGRDLLLIRGSGADLEEVLSILDEIDRCLSFVFEGPDGVEALTCAELAGVARPARISRSRES